MVIAARQLESTCERTAVVYRNGALETDVPFENLAERAADGGALVWLDLEKPTDAELEEIQREFELHPLAVEDIRHPKPRPKLDEYEGSLLVVLYHIGVDGDELRLHPLALFVGPGYLITLHQKPIPALGEARERWHKDPKMVEPSPLGFLVYRIASALI